MVELHLLLGCEGNVSCKMYKSKSKKSQLGGLIVYFPFSSCNKKTTYDCDTYEKLAIQGNKLVI